MVVPGLNSFSNCIKFVFLDVSFSSACSVVVCTLACKFEDCGLISGWVKVLKKLKAKVSKC